MFFLLLYCETTTQLAGTGGRTDQQNSHVAREILCTAQRASREEGERSERAEDDVDDDIADPINIIWPSLRERTMSNNIMMIILLS